MKKLIAIITTLLLVVGSGILTSNEMNCVKKVCKI